MGSAAPELSLGRSAAVPRAHRLERAEFAPVLRDLVRLEYGAAERPTDLRAAFSDGYGRSLTEIEEEALRCYAAIDALSGMQWGTAHGDDDVVARARRALDRLG